MIKINNPLYLEYLFNQFKAVKGIPASENDIAKYEDDLAKWILERKNAVSTYISLFEYMRMPSTDTLPIPEIDKGGEDTVLDKLSERSYEVVGISKFANTFDPDASYKVYDGSLFDCHGRTFIATDMELSNTIESGNKIIMTHLPIDQYDFDMFLSLCLQDRNVFIGAYGEYHDKDKIANVKTLERFYNELRESVPFECSGNKADIMYDPTGSHYAACVQVVGSQYCYRNSFSRR